MTSETPAPKLPERCGPPGPAEAGWVPAAKFLALQQKFEAQRAEVRRLSKIVRGITKLIHGGHFRRDDFAAENSSSEVAG